MAVFFGLSLLECGREGVKNNTDFVSGQASVILSLALEFGFKFGVRFHLCVCVWV